LAAALAKAQIELINPEKSMIAAIRVHERSDAEQIFRYAPLSSGLEILRKTLGQYEIAILQATAIDQATGVVNLTTTLCHSSRHGRFAQSMRWRAPKEWAPPSPTRGVMLCSH
jgi:hypothetical protein